MNHINTTWQERDYRSFADCLLLFLLELPRIVFHSNWGYQGVVMIWASFWENRSSGFPTRSDANYAVQLQKMARGSAQLICGFVSAYAKIRVSQNVAHIIQYTCKYKWIAEQLTKCFVCVWRGRKYRFSNYETPLILSFWVQKIASNYYFHISQITANNPRLDYFISMYIFMSLKIQPYHDAV